MYRLESKYIFRKDEEDANGSGLEKAASTATPPASLRNPVGANCHLCRRKGILVFLESKLSSYVELCTPFI